MVVQEKIVERVSHVPKHRQTRRLTAVKSGGILPNLRHLMRQADSTERRSVAKIHKGGFNE